MYHIYTLIHNNKPFYIGKAKDIKSRLSSHIKYSKRKKLHTERYISKAISNNEEITIEILDSVNIGSEDYWEIYWISQFKTWGFKLTNMTSGGEGGDYWSGKKHSEETIQKLRLIRTKQLDKQKEDNIVVKCLGESNGRSKLNADKVIEIRKLREDGYSNYKLAEKFGVSRTTIIRIVSRVLWSHI